MRPRSSISGSDCARPRKRGRGFTLPEVLITATLFLFVLGGVIFAHLFGLRLFQMTNTKLWVTQWARLTTESLADQIHGSYSVQVGNKTAGGFVGFLPGETNQGTSLLIQPTENPTNYIVYFVNVADQTFRRTDQSGNAAILADSITNTLAFSAQDFSGNVLTNRQNSQVIHLTLEFYHPPNYMERADYFKLETSMKQRVVPQ
jgi:prepilin-type N-terminal cleavage/methylation domain-containing protein